VVKTTGSMDTVSELPHLLGELPKRVDGFPAVEPGMEASAFIGVYRRLDSFLSALTLRGQWNRGLTPMNPDWPVRSHLSGQALASGQFVHQDIAARGNVHPGRTIEAYRDNAARRFDSVGIRARPTVLSPNDHEDTDP